MNRDPAKAKIGGENLFVFGAEHALIFVNYLRHADDLKKKNSEKEAIAGVFAELSRKCDSRVP